MAVSSRTMTGVLKADSLGCVPRNSVLVRPFAAEGRALSTSDKRSSSSSAKAPESSVSGPLIVIVDPVVRVLWGRPSSGEGP